MRHITLAVIGHVDHGKTTLVKTLTGQDTDTLAEERARGLSIVPGFAFGDFGDLRVNLIDTPGHEDFVRGAIASMSGASGVLLVVAASDGIKPQTREHLRIAGLFGITQAIVAVTKADLLQANERADKIDSIKTFLSDTPFADAPVLLCDARKAEGVLEIKRALTSLTVAATPTGPPFPLLAIDRVFSPSGVGVVVTGTLPGRSLRLDDALTVMPAGHKTSVRGLEVNGVAVDTAPAGARVAVNLRGISQEAIARGNVLCPPGTMEASLRADVKIQLPEDATRPLKHMEEVQIFSGTGHAPTTARLFSGPVMRAGETGFAQLQFRVARSFYAGELFILRRFSPPETLGGGIVIDPAAAPIGRHKAAQENVLAAALEGETQALLEALSARDGGAVSARELARLCPGAMDLISSEALIDAGDGLLVLQDIATITAQDIETALHDLHTAFPLRLGFALTRLQAAIGTAHPALTDCALKRLLDAARICKTAGRFALSSHDPHAAMTTAQKAAFSEREERLRVAGLNAIRVLPPEGEPSETDDLLDLLIATGKAVKLYNHGLKQALVFHADVVATTEKRLRTAFSGKTRFSTSEARALLGTSRRIIVPLLEHFDATGITTRNGDFRWLNGAD